MTLFLFIRHGETAAVGRRLVGRNPGIVLTERGVGQVARLAERLQAHRIDRIVSSPMERARQSAIPIADRLGLELQMDDGLLEVDFGAWTGVTFEDIAADTLWQRYHRFRSGIRIPGGEMALEIQTRMVAVTERIRREHPGERVALVSHGDPIRYALAFYAGVPLDLALRLEVDVASASVVEVGDEGARILCLNHTGELPRFE